MLEADGVWVIEDGNHEGLSIHRQGGRYEIYGWAENWDDTWAWQAEITPEDVEATLADPPHARHLLATSRMWRVFPPSSVSRSPYEKEGFLSSADGFEDAGTGGKA